MIYLSVFPEMHPFILVGFPWFWVTISGNQDGGFSIDIEESPRVENYDPFTNQIVYIKCYPHEIRGQHWQIPNTPEAWQDQFIAVWDNLMGWLNGG